MEPLAKPSGITYKEHRQHVHDEAAQLLRCHPFWSRKYELMTANLLPSQVLRAAWWHDEGKKHPKWSKACRDDYQLYQNWRQQKGLSPVEADAKRNAKDFKKYGDEMKRLKKSTGPHLMKATLRHEFQSLLDFEKKFGRENVTLAERVAIAAHHGKLNVRHEKRWREDGPYADLWESLNDDSKGLIERGVKGEWAKKIQERYKIAGVRALLHLADTRASAEESGGNVPEIPQFTYSFPHPKKKAVQEIAEQMGANAGVSILRAPTGSGKTDAALLWAKRQIEEKRADRLVIAMPTRFTSNALSISVAENISMTGLYHSSALYNRKKESTKVKQRKLTSEEHGEAFELHKLAQFLATPVTVCTIDHLLISLTGTKEEHHTTFFFLANSAVVFDEADFYDPFIQANLLVLLETLRFLKVPVLIMSATVPDSSKALYGIESIEDVPAEANNPRRAMVWRGAAETPKDVEGILKGMVRQRTGIVYANTVDRAYAYYQWFWEEYQKGGPKPILYHSRFTEDDKVTIEDELKKALGKDVWLDSNHQPDGIAILTAIGEMSVNISAPIMLSDVCPWDRLAQRAGRLDRFGLSPNGGVLYVVEPIKNNETYPAPYGEYQRGNGWKAAVAFTQTLEELKNQFDEVPQTVSPEQFVKWVNDLYPEQMKFESKAKTNCDELKRAMRTNWLIVQGQYTNEDDGKAGTWKSRDIPPQETIFVTLPEWAEYDGDDKKVYPFGSWEDFRAYQLEYGISCPIYLTKKGKELNQLIPFKYQIGDDKEEKTLWITSLGVYRSDTGLATLGQGEKIDRANGKIVD